MTKPSHNAPSSTESSRGSMRQALTLRAAKLVEPGGEYLCILRDISSGGFKARLFHSLPCQTHYILEMADGQAQPIELVWADSNHAGFRFLEGPIDERKLISDLARFSKRGLRLRLRIPALVKAGGLAAPAQLEDISQQGARITCETFLAVGLLVRLDAPCLPARVAKVRWRRSGIYGLVFEQIFQFEELAAAVAQAQALPLISATQPALAKAAPSAA